MDIREPGLAKRLLTLRQAEAVKGAEAKRLAVARDEAKAKALNAQAASETADAAREVLIALGEIKQAEVSSRVEALVTRALCSVLGKKFEFKFRWDEKRGTATAEPVLVVEKNGQKIDVDILDGKGGGVVDIVSFVLRFLLAKYTPGLRKILILDEPFRHVSAEFAEGIGVLFGLLSEKTGFRFLIVTHSERIAERADHCYRAVFGEDERTTFVHEEKVIE